MTTILKLQAVQSRLASHYYHVGQMLLHYRTANTYKPGTKGNLMNCKIAMEHQLHSLATWDEYLELFLALSETEDALLLTVKRHCQTLP